MSTEKIISPLAQSNLDICRERIDASPKDSVSLPRACEILAAAGLRIVNEDAMPVRPEIMRAIVTIASAALRHPETIRKLVWED
jgi:hypothetical protein